MSEYKVGDIFKIRWNTDPILEPEYYMLSCVPEGYIFICVQECEDGYLGEWLSNEFVNIKDAETQLSRVINRSGTYEKVSEKDRVVEEYICCISLECRLFCSLWGVLCGI